MAVMTSDGHGVMLRNLRHLPALEREKEEEEVGRDGLT